MSVVPEPAGRCSKLALQQTNKQVTTEPTNKQTHKQTQNSCFLQLSLQPSCVPEPVFWSLRADVRSVRSRKRNKQTHKQNQTAAVPAAVMCSGACAQMFEDCVPANEQTDHHRPNQQADKQAEPSSCRCSCLVICRSACIYGPTNLRRIRGLEVQVHPQLYPALQGPRKDSPSFGFCYRIKDHRLGPRPKDRPSLSPPSKENHRFPIESLGRKKSTPDKKEHP